MLCRDTDCIHSPALSYGTAAESVLHLAAAQPLPIKVKKDSPLALEDPRRPTRRTRGREGGGGGDVPLIPLQPLGFHCMRSQIQSDFSNFHTVKLRFAGVSIEQCEAQSKSLSFEPRGPPVSRTEVHSISKCFSYFFFLDDKYSVSPTKGDASFLPEVNGSCDHVLHIR